MQDPLSRDAMRGCSNRGGTMRMTWILLLFAFVAGVCLPVQFSVNAQLRGVVGGPTVAAAISFLVGTIALVVAASILREPLPGTDSVSNTSWWMWTGGCSARSTGDDHPHPPAWCRHHDRAGLGRAGDRLDRYRPFRPD